MKHILCRLGVHRWRDLYRGEWNGFTQDVVMQCTRCAKRERTTFVSPLSGPRTGEMHPKAHHWPNEPWELV